MNTLISAGVCYGHIVFTVLSVAIIGVINNTVTHNLKGRKERKKEKFVP